MGNCVANAVLSPKLGDMLSRFRAVCKEIRRVAARPGSLLRDIVHQIMDMEHIATGKDAGNTGFQLVRDLRTAGDAA